MIYHLLNKHKELKNFKKKKKILNRRQRKKRKNKLKKKLKTKSTIHFGVKWMK